MFTRKPRRKFHVSTSRFYIAGKQSTLQKLHALIRPYKRRAVYRTNGSLLAL